MHQSLQFLALFVLFCGCSPTTPAQTWEHLGTAGGTILSLAAAPCGDIYLGASDGHIFARSFGASHWELLGRAGNIE